MAILNWKMEFPDQVADSGSQQTRLGRLACNDSLATVLGAGYLNQLVNVGGNGAYNVNTNQGYQPLPQDFWLIYYSGGYGLFGVSINASGIISLFAVGKGFVQVAITAAQFNGMYAAPVALVPAPGAGALLVFDSMELILPYNSAAYAAGGPVAVQYDSTVHGGGVLASNTEQATDFQVTASNTYIFGKATGNSSNLPWSTTVNKGLYLSNSSAAFTTGNSPLVANVYFHTITGV
ncbi:MAG: hypothetical protein KGJ07_00285 [Patescibacteria group bacterium]|nr:hypothetical protein [Patescibacteria group bacterium]